MARLLRTAYGGGESSREGVVVQREVSVPPADLGGERGPERDIAMPVEIVAVRLAAGLLPEDLVPTPSHHLGHELLVRRAGDLDLLGASPTGLAEHSDHVGVGRFDQLE